MTFDAAWLESQVKLAVKEFWTARNGGDGVRAGKTLNAFLDIVEQVVEKSGLPNVQVYTGKHTSQLPGYFRPHKCWDAVIINNGVLVAALELKSQVGSIGNNFNNRTEEVLGSSIDLRTAIEESAFGENPNIFTGYLIVVEQSEKTTTEPRIDMKYFPVMEGFLADETERGVAYNKGEDGTYPRSKGISYLKRYDLMCKRLMIKNLYSAASVVAIPSDQGREGEYNSVSAETSIRTFMLKLANHCEVLASIEEQKKN